MLVKLYELPDSHQFLDRVRARRVTIRHPRTGEKRILTNWVQNTFGPRWAKECEVSFISSPATCFVAERENNIIGFACYECTAKNFFGPAGVAGPDRGQGVGTALLIACLQAMKTLGYGYAIIGGVGPAEFYTKTVGATLIQGSETGIYSQANR